MGYVTMYSIIHPYILLLNKNQKNVLITLVVQDLRLCDQVAE